MAGFVGQRHVLGEKLDQMSSTQFTTGLKVWLGITYNIARDGCMDYKREVLCVLGCKAILPCCLLVCQQERLFQVVMGHL